MPAREAASDGRAERARVLTAKARLAASVAALVLAVSAPGGKPSRPTPAGAGAPPPAPTSAEAIPLGSHPLCEPSAAVRAPWDPDSVLVADNEVSSGLFLFRREGGRLVDPQRLALPENLAPGDIEALAVADGDLVIVGSQSRNKRCELRPARQRILVTRWEAARRRLEPVRLIRCGDAWRKAAATTDGCLKTLFTSPPPPLARELCASIVRAEQQARPGTRECTTLNVEGAVALPRGSGADRQRIWLGLRSPLVGPAAALVRLTPGLDAFRFDAVALVGAGGLGIRELALAAGRVWLIAGPEGFRPGEPHSLWSVPEAALAPGARLLAEGPPVALPASSEGMDLAGGEIIALIDGDYGGEGARACLVPGRQIAIRLPSAARSGNEP